MRTRIVVATVVALSALGPVSLSAQDTSLAEGAAAWARIYATAAHPRCTNCHVGESGRPGWEGLGYAPGRLHGMNVQAGESRIGAETIPCRTCHISAQGANARPHAAPQIDDAWRLPPAGLAWQGFDTAALCALWADPARNDGFEVSELIDHVRESAFVNWGFTPGGGREPAPGSAEELAQDLALWAAAGQPCPAD